MKIFLLQCLLFSMSLSAIVYEGIDYKEKITASEKEFSLNGVGIRKATMLKLRIYTAGLYMTNKSTAVETVLDPQVPKVVRLVFVRDLGKDRIVSGFRDALMENKAAPESLKGFEEFAKVLTDVKEGDELLFIFENGQMKFQLNSKPLYESALTQLSTDLLGVWFKYPANKELSAGMLGL